MRNQWYGDSRDLVKWSAVHRVATERPTRIIYLPMLTPDEPPFDELTLTDGNGLPKAVLQHFRDASQAERIRWPDGASFVSLDGFFENRDGYFRSAVEMVKNRKEGGPRVMVLFDPDTGIEPPSGGDTRHILGHEIRTVFDQLRPGDVLAVYQHARRTKSWLRDTREEVERALSVSATNVRTFQCRELAWDVAMFVVEKST